jgi:hypothetical protein
MAELEAEWRIDVFDERGDQNVATLRVRGFFPDPLGFDRVPGPEHDNGAGAREPIGDPFVESLAGQELAIPPHLPSEQPARRPEWSGRGTDLHDHRDLRQRLAAQRKRVAHRHGPS